MIVFPYRRNNREEVNLTITKVEQLATEYKVIFLPCEQSNTYQYALETLWYIPLDVILVEHDMEIKREAIDKLYDCPYPLCAQTYLSHPESTGLDHPIVAHRNITWVDGKQVVEFATEGQEFAMFAAFGMTKIGRMFRKAYPPDWEKTSEHFSESWIDLDHRFSTWINELGYKWHLHWPVVEHYHKSKSSSDSVRYGES